MHFKNYLYPEYNKIQKNILEWKDWLPKRFRLRAITIKDGQERVGYRVLKAANVSVKIYVLKSKKQLEEETDVKYLIVDAEQETIINLNTILTKYYKGYLKDDSSEYPLVVQTFSEKGEDFYSLLFGYKLENNSTNAADLKFYVAREALKMGIQVFCVNTYNTYKNISIFDINHDKLCPESVLESDRTKNYFKQKPVKPSENINEGEKSK